jgi:release factor glutamine methyltransferase
MTASAEDRDSLADALARGTARLAAAGVEMPARDARRLLAHAAGIASDRLTLHLRDPLGAEAAARYEAALAARAGGRPVARITGLRLFWGRTFSVTDAVLDPRPETETLVAAALEAPIARLLDVGTGSGILAISLLAERPAATGVATDIDAAALEVARANAHAHGVANRLEMRRTDWVAGVTGPFDLIVSNPPYIPAVDLPGLAPEVRDHDPPHALTDGRDGLTAYARIAGAAPGLLAPEGRLIVEVGAGQDGAVAALFSAAGLVVDAPRPDMDGRDRAVIARLSRPVG